MIVKRWALAASSSSDCAPRSLRPRERRARLERARGAIGRDLASGIGERGASSEVGATVDSSPEETEGAT